ncbi:hypothetical protein GQ600_10450 [Phytophthora cactorum]|nr:hypothetical protein GQ600_10450 [Phytophthora cactorum]
MGAESEVEQLRRANELLRTEVADLTSALLARDLELVRLRDRCQFLTTAVEQQDEVIAKIYATTTTANGATKGSMVTALPVPTAGSTLGSGLGKEKVNSSSKLNEKRTLMSSMKIYPGAVGMADPVEENTADSVEKTVESFMSPELEQLSEDVVKIDLDSSLTRHELLSTRITTVRLPVSIVRAVLRQPRRPRPFLEILASQRQSPPRSWNSLIVKRRPSLERQDSSPTEEVFARSAGFLRKSNRTMSGRLSVSDLGLLHNDDDDDDVESNQTQEAASLSPHEQLNNEENSLDFGDSGGSILSTRSRSQRDLFAGVDEALKAKTKQKQIGRRPSRWRGGQFDLRRVPATDQSPCFPRHFGQDSHVCWLHFGTAWRWTTAALDGLR